MICSIPSEAFNLSANTTALRERYFLKIVISFEQFLFWKLLEATWLYLQDHVHGPGSPGNKAPRRDQHWCPSEADSERCLKLRLSGVLRFRELSFVFQIQSRLMKQAKKGTWPILHNQHTCAPTKPCKLSVQLTPFLIQNGAHYICVEK